jgi:hypothetical protein
MTDPDLCANDALLDYLYDEADAATRRWVESHVAVCAACAAELESLRGVRRDLQSWTPPAARLGFRVVQDPAPRAWLTRAPAWGLAAAAALVLGVSAAIARVEVRYGTGGLVVRTGWTGAAPEASRAPVASVPPRADGSPWRVDLDALERRLRSEIAARPRETAMPAAVSATDEELLRRVRALVSDSEERQQRELALRLTQVLQDVERQRRADLVRIEQGFGQLEGLTGAEVARQRQMLNYLVSVSQRR